MIKRSAVENIEQAFCFSSTIRKITLLRIVEQHIAQNKSAETGHNDEKIKNAYT